MSMDLEFSSNKEEAIAKLRDGAKAGAKAAGMEGEGYVKEKLSGQGHGKMRYLPGGGQYQASAPGEPPAERTGTLLGSYSNKVQRRRGGYEAVVGSDLPYAVHMEFGAPGANIDARPHLRPALRENREALQELMQAGIEGEFDD